MKLLIEIPEEQYRTLNAKSQNDIVTAIDDALLIKAIRNGKPLDDVLDEIKAKIEDESYLSYDDNPRHIIDESWVLEIIDKHRKESDGK